MTGTGSIDLLDAQDVAVDLDNLKNAVAATREVRDVAQFEGGGPAGLKDPTEGGLDIEDRYFQLSLEVYSILSSASL